MLTKLNRNINPLEKFQSTFISFKVILRLFALARGLPFKKRPGRLLKPAQTVLTFSASQSFVPWYSAWRKAKASVGNRHLYQKLHEESILC